jgi:hypothetical protein
MTTTTVKEEKSQQNNDKTMEHYECYSINIAWDDEARVWVATSDDIPLALESGSFDALIERVRVAAPEILALNSSACIPAQFLIKSERLIVNG